MTLGLKPILVSSGEPAGIGPDICLALARHSLPVVILADKSHLEERARLLGLDIVLRDYDSDNFKPSEHVLSVLAPPSPSPAPVTAGQLDVKQAPFVIEMLETATKACLAGDFSALVTAPVHKGIINQAGIPFTGHTEFLANYCNVPTVVMMLVCDSMRVALATTHLPLNQVSSHLTKTVLMEVISELHQSLIRDFACPKPRMLVAGLNPHAGEGGFLGSEEIEVIKPALKELQEKGLDVQGPYPADTLFTAEHMKEADVFVAMYHDQGLPVLKYASFGQAVNITLGLPIIRTSVDHGTACELAGTGKANASSLIQAVKKAREMAEVRTICQRFA